jgi:hypothetical protein
MGRAPVVELLWFDDCPNHESVRQTLREIVEEVAPGATMIERNASDPDEAARLRFPGSPTVRVNGRDVDPRYLDPGDYTPRCRLYWTAEGLRGVPERAWIEAALRAAVVESNAEVGRDA